MRHKSLTPHKSRRCHSSHFVCIYIYRVLILLQGVKVKVKSSIFELMRGAIGGVSVRGLSWNTPLSLSCRQMKVWRDHQN